MTDEELQRTLREINADIEKLADDEKLAGKERRRKRLLLMKKETLQKIEQARKKQNTAQEIKLLTSYGAMVSLGEKHPLLLYLLHTKLRMNIF
jgi:tmRNA-binding protein